ncbi:hypothetical protein IMY05_C4238000100 [Salix suchowensis]|nr:hypothetical protein IMY05_C4238000100 [Salix suchowensis]
MVHPAQVESDGGEFAGLTEMVFSDDSTHHLKAMDLLPPSQPVASSLNAAWLANLGNKLPQVSLNQGATAIDDEAAESTRPDFPPSPLKFNRNTANATLPKHCSVICKEPMHIKPVSALMTSDHVATKETAGNASTHSTFTMPKGTFSGDLIASSHGSRTSAKHLGAQFSMKNQLQGMVHGIQRIPITRYVRLSATGRLDESTS